MGRAHPEDDVPEAAAIVSATEWGNFIALRAHPEAQPEIQEPADVVALCERVVDTIALPFTLNGHDVIVTASVGAVLFRVDADETDRLMQNADIALYRAKAEGWNRFRFFDRHAFAHSSGSSSSRRRASAASSPYRTPNEKPFSPAVWARAPSSRSAVRR